MDTNEKARQVLELINKVSGDLLVKSEDGKIDLGDLLGTLTNSMPIVVKLLRSAEGN